ncbi:serine hydrolase domain-containing protein [Leptospira levettii]|uniref:serine hydrolase domain-containing protein n=1 Tax=Leptospira levettii TaxID=2023178 RepID=UPI00108478DC|nr:serine hydrolase [Leptospira levettii]MCW7506400.1 beta-lactamase family protein [Leptospira levettii]MCW7517490.1 beta-lactamase family protein [Leptospira levettii]TGL01050.1 class C beta-lactamase-related serine hydrolase [Leptospira levettii]
MKLNKSYPQITLFILTFVYSTIHSGPTKPENCPKPILDREWQITTNLETEFDQNLFCGYVHEIGSEDSEFHSFLIERHGKIVTEVYNTRADHPFNKRYGTRFPFDGETQFDSNTLHDVRSVSKTVVSLLFGIAIDKKIIDGVDVPVLSYYPELQIPKNDPKQIITWKHLLTMSSGLDWEEWRYGFLFSDETRLLWKKDLTQFFFDRDLIHTPGTIFNYNGGGTSVLSDILTKKTNKSLKELAKEWLFTPLEIHNFEWVEDRNGRALAHAGLRLRPRDMLKLGRFVLNGGNWKGKQIVSKQWLDDSLKKQINSQVKIFRKDGKSLFYGYQWWLGETILEEKKIPWSVALGNGGQLIFAFPSMDMVIVTTAGGYGDPTTIQRILETVERILTTVK